MTASARRAATFLLRQSRQVQGFREQLADNLALTLLWIPPGRFWMGSPQSEPEHHPSEGPQHLVQLEGFFMGQTPITQAQWREVAGWEPREGETWGRQLEPNPSYFQTVDGKGNGQLFKQEASTDQRPVERVSWEEAMAFCSRLSQRTGRTYTLPSEAQWEYACRAGTTTPFAFGETLTDELANYRASSTYGKGPKGACREQTTPVGMFPANGWGLQDMHGNVWEWCLDQWHGTYEGAPEDGNAWFVRGQSKDEGSSREEKDRAGDIRSKLLRGGSWDDLPKDCRSASRVRCKHGAESSSIGLRVACISQAPSRNA